MILSEIDLNIIHNKIMLFFAFLILKDSLLTIHSSSHIEYHI